MKAIIQRVALGLREDKEYCISLHFLALKMIVQSTFGYQLNRTPAIIFLYKGQNIFYGCVPVWECFTGGGNIKQSTNRTSHTPLSLTLLLMRSLPLHTKRV